MKRNPGDIKVICVDRMCFYVGPVWLEPRCVSFYDAYAFAHPEPPEMTSGEWIEKRNKMRDEARRACYYGKTLSF